ncbi:beta-lactamase family protein [Actinomycetaceae bacterium TAE3-ERU4]|nr:beta-lactamase family protein [Actinomycetaceae bacterium TAE3-ERU4]
MTIPGFDFPCGLAVTNSRSTLAYSGEVERPFALASVTKLLTSWAIAVAVSQAKVTYDDPAGPPGATLRHLLSHASGLDFASDQIVNEVGTRRVYSNRGIEVAAEYVAQKIGLSISEMLSSLVAKPLGMETWSIEGSPAYAGVASVLDLLKFAREVLEPKLISSNLRDEILCPQFPELAGIVPGYGLQRPNLWGLGFEIRGQKSPHWTAPGAALEVSGHFGQSGSFLWVDCALGLGAVFAGGEKFGAVHKEKWPQINQQILNQFS